MTTDPHVEQQEVVPGEDTPMGRNELIQEVAIQLFVKMTDPNFHTDHNNTAANCLIAATEFADAWEAAFIYEQDDGDQLP